MPGKRSLSLQLRNPRLSAWVGRRAARVFEHVLTLARGASNTGVVQGVVQRSSVAGMAAWGKIASRWPALAELVRERGLGLAGLVQDARPREKPRPEHAVAHGVALGAEAIDALIAQLVSSSSWQARASAAMSLGHVSADGVVPALVRALRDHSVEVAVAAADALSGQRDEHAVTELLGVLENREGYYSPVTRVAAISGLARRLDVARFDPVFAALRDIDAEVSIAAVAVIAERVPGRAGKLLLPVLCDKTGYYLPLVRLAVANALERAGALHSGVVGEILPHEVDPSVRRVLERANYLAAPPHSAE
jgi:HEAT repeat protein